MKIYLKSAFRKIVCSASVLTAIFFGMPSLAHDQGPISVHSPTQSKLYYGYGPVWNTSFAGWNTARMAAWNACNAAGEANCILSVAAWDHCTFWGEGDFTTGNPPRYLCISHPKVMVDPKQECEVTLGGVYNDDGDCVVTTTGTSPYIDVLRAAGRSGRGWTEMGIDTTTTIKMYEWAGSAWADVPFFEESQTVREVQACYNPGGQNMGTNGQCGK